MGTSYSTANISLSAFPEELLVEILSSLTVPDLISCRRVNRYLNDIVDRSQQLQHHIDTAVAGVLDNPNSPLSLRERRDALARRQEAWDTLTPQWTTSATCKFGDEFSWSDETWLPLDPLREGYHTIENLAACPNNDGLVAVGVRCGGVQPIGYIGAHSLEVDIFRLSGGGGERLWTRHRTIQAKDVVNEDGVRWEMDIEIHTNLLVVLLKPVATRIGVWPDRELCFFNWETGEEIASLTPRIQKIYAFSFLSSSIMVVASPSESTATLELFSIRVTKGSATLEKVAALRLPFVDLRWCIASIEFATPHVKNLRIQCDRKVLFYNASINMKPFISPISDSIIFATLFMRCNNSNGNISFAVHPSTLLRHALPSHPYGHMEALVPWESWGPAVTRWHEGPIIPGFLGGSIICGDRCLFPPSSNQLPWQPRRFNQPRELWDFNPYRVRCLKQGLSIETETACMTIETEPSCTKCQGFRKGIYSSLPFVKIIPKKWPRNGQMDLYEDKVVICKMDLSGENFEIQQLYFG